VQRLRRLAGGPRRLGDGSHDAHLAHEIDEGLHVADEVPTREVLVAQDVAQRLARGPRVSQRREPRVGSSRRGEPRRLLVGLQLRGQPLELVPAGPHLARREPRRLGLPRPAMLVGEARQQAGQGRRVEAVEQARRQRLRDQQVGLVVRAGQHLALRGEGPPLEVAPRLHEPQDTVEPPGQRAGAGPHLPAHVRQLAMGPLHLGVGAHVAVAVGAAVDGVGLHRRQGLRSVSASGAPTRRVVIGRVQP
jgi:hypothetical protein